MKKFLPHFSALILALSSLSAFAQGGDNCASAQANPITLPFGPAAGSTCSATDDYTQANMTNPCLPNYYFSQNDWLYYFCTNSAGMLQFTIDVGSQYPYCSMSLWSGCPLPNGNCVASTTTLQYNSSTFTYQMTLSTNVQNNQCFFLLIDGYNIAGNCFSWTANASITPPPATNPTCVNMDFETGNFNGWYGTDGTITCGAVNAPYPVYNFSTAGLPSPQHTIMTGPGTDACGGFPVVCPGGNYSVMIGDGQNVGSLGGTLEQTFMVSASNSAFTYKYAAVVQDASHLNNEQPFFLIDMYDQNGNMIQCAHYVVVGGPNIPNFFTANCSFGVYYRPWTTVNVDLSAYIGQPVRILFTVGDCCYGGHFGYVYVDATCAPMQITGNDSICVNNCTTLTAPNGSANYSWSTGATTQSINVCPTQQPYQIYTCTLTSITNPNCLTVLKDTVWVFPNPQATFTANPNGGCSGGTVSVTNNTVNNGYQFSWTWGDNTNSTGQNPSPHTYSSSGTYTITLYVSAGGCVDTVSQVITINGGGPQSAFSNTTVCLNNATQFTDLSTGGPTTWSWNFGDPNSGPNNTSTTQNPSHTFTASGSYTVTLVTSSGNPNCADTLQMTVVVDPLPTPAFVANSVCVGQPTQFTDQSTIQSGSITAWAWNFGDPNSGPNNLSTAQNPTHTFTAAGTYTVTLTTTSNNGCLNSTTVVITVYPLPTAAFAANPVCTGNPMQFTDQSTGATGWTWDYGDASPQGNAQNPTHVYANAGNYTVTLTVSNAGGCTATTTLQVTVNPGPSSAFQATTVCVGQPTVFTDQSTITTGTITNWSWNFGDNTTSAQQNPSHTYASAGTYQVSLVTTSNNGCTNTVTLQVVVNPLPSAAFINTSVCVGSPTQFTDQSTIASGNITQWAWSFGDNSTSTQQSPSHTYASAGTYTVTLVVNSAAGCPDSIQQVINVYALPVVAFTADDTDGCVTHCVNFTDQSTVAGGNITGWFWDFGDGGTSTSQNPNHCYTVAGTYDVTLTVTSNNGCTSTYTNFAYIIVYPLPVAEFSATPNPTSIIDPTVHFFDLSTGNPITWYWTFGDNGANDSIQNPSHEYPNDNTGIHYYTVTLDITDVHGCTSTVSHVVEVDPEFTFFAPNCFTPNNDGIDELFFVYGVGWKQFKMWIFDRWGNKIFWTDDMNKGWDGKVLGGPSDDLVQEDVYVWKVQITDVFDKKHSYIGHVSVIK